MQSNGTQVSLKLASAIVAGFGIVVALAAHPATAGITAFFADLLFWPLDGVQTMAGSEARLLSAIGGGVMVGWGVLLWLISSRLYPREPELARAMILWSVGIWYVIDSAFSVAAGAPLNALLNVGFVLLFYVPLMRSESRAAA